MALYVYTDGASRGNPGEGASGYFIFDSTHKLLAKEVFYNGVCTNNVAEYKAIIAALKRMLKEHKRGVELVLTSDSNVVVNQLSGNFKIRDAKLKLLNMEAMGLLKKFKKYRLLNVRRENGYIRMVDTALNEFLDKKLL